MFCDPTDGYCRVVVVCRVFYDQLEPLICSEFEDCQAQVKVKSLLLSLLHGFVNDYLFSYTDTILSSIA